MSKYYDRDGNLLIKISSSLEENIENIEKLFENCNDIVKKSFVLERGEENGLIYVVYVDGLTNDELVDNVIIKPLSYEWRGNDKVDLWNSIYFMEAQTVDIKEETDLQVIISTILKGDTAVFVDGYSKAMLVSSKKFPLRAISVNEKESSIRGPRDAFNENLRTSTALIRRRIRDSRLKVEQGFIGRRSRTDYAIMYIDDIVAPGLVEKVKERLDKYDIDAVFDSGMVEHLMEEKWYSPFPIMQSTSRPDKAASAITEGRVVVVVDNSPEVIIAPSNFNVLFQASDDYYNRWTVATFARILRYVAAFLAIALPGFYIAIATYHSQAIPTKMLFAIISARTAITFPIVIEILIMEIFFELLREAGMRLPGQMGNTIGVVGGLIVGQAAVEAGLVSTIVVIIVALTAIASFSIPNEEFASVFRLIKFFIIITSSLLGLYGFILGMIVVAIHLAEITSFGVPYMMPVVSGSIDKMRGSQDFIVKSPIQAMKKRPIFATNQNKTRLKKK